MINTAPMTAILPVGDLTRAADFYRDRLGLKDLGPEPSGNHLFQIGSGSQIGLMLAEEGAQSAHTVLAFEVEDVYDGIKELEGRGVTFLDYDLPDFKTVDHVLVVGGEKAAWFADTEGNILCVHEQSPEA